MIHKRFQKAILVLLAICGVLSVTPQTARAYPAEDGPGHGVVIGFIDSEIAPYHLDETHILPGKNYVFGDAEHS